ncbi:MAG: ferritin-like domain-containing protein [Kiritimatiellia bacterium]
MNGSPAIIATLNKLLLGEWQARRQYEAVGALFAVRGYLKIATEYRDRASDEAGHALRFQERIAELDGDIVCAPSPDPILVNDLEAQINASLTIENTARADLQSAIRETEADGDYGTGDICRGILHGSGSEEEHIREIEADLIQIEAEGLQNWLSTQR